MHALTINRARKLVQCPLFKGTGTRAHSILFDLQQTKMIDNPEMQKYFVFKKIIDLFQKGKLGKTIKNKSYSLYTEELKNK